MARPELRLVEEELTRADDQRLGEIAVCICSTLRYERGHIASCPLNAYPAHVVAIDLGGTSVRPFRRPGA